MVNVIDESLTHESGIIIKGREEESDKRERRWSRGKRERQG